MDQSEVIRARDGASAPRFRRVLGLWDLIFYGIVLIMPIAAVPLFGLAQKLSNGHAATTILIAMIAMMLTALSYGRMATVYPMAGSAYTYVGRCLNPHLGFLTGWTMFLDYLICPMICTIYGVLTVQRLLPQIPYVVLAAFFVGMMTFLNLWGIRTTARTNLILLIIMSAGIGIFIVLAIHFLLAREGWRGLFSMRPFYTPKDFNLRSIATGTSLAALTYIGFDGVTTLAEEVKNPKRNVLLATVLVCLFTGIFSGLQIYLAQRVWPDYHTFTNIETAFMDVTAKVGGMALFRVMGGILIIASLGSGLTAQVGAARVLFGMGRDNYLPRKVFAHLDVKRNTPTYNLLMIAVVVFLGSLVVSYEVGAEVLNFGAFLAFMGVNLATLRYFWFTPHPGRKRRWLADALLPSLGFLFCLAIWLNLPRPAKMLGSLWLLVGVTYAAIHTRGFHRRPAMIDLMAINSADSPKSSALL